MRHTPPASSVLRALLLGSLGFASACSSNVEDDASDGSGGANSGGANSGGEDAGGNADGGTEPDASAYREACTNSVPLIEGVDTGIFSCSEGYLHRAEARECASTLPRAGEEPVPDGVMLESDTCTHDADCPGPNDRCTVWDGRTGNCMVGIPASHRVRECLPGCRVDADCAADQVCVCGADIGTCAAIAPDIGCHTDADCDEGALCLQNAVPDTLSWSAFGCQLRGDTCDSSRDCVGSPQTECRLGPGGRSCQPLPTCGRPYVVCGAPRLAGAILRDDWCDGESAPAGVDAELGAFLVEHWTRIGLMEHASVAAFARFTMQLLSLGAPIDLVRASTDAQADEIRHAELAFGLAARYGGGPVGPSGLSLDGALDGMTLEAILRTTIEEGCVGETRAALEAAEAAAGTVAPDVRRVLERIASDESDHAALAWKVVRWLLGEHPELAGIARDEFARAAARAAAEPSRSEGTPPVRARAHGVLDGATLARVHRDALEDVIAPCAAVLLDPGRARSLHGAGPTLRVATV